MNRSLSASPLLSITQHEDKYIDYWRLVKGFSPSAQVQNNGTKLICICVIPAEAGIYFILDSGLRWNDKRAKKAPVSGRRVLVFIYLPRVVLLNVRDVARDEGLHILTQLFAYLAIRALIPDAQATIIIDILLRYPEDLLMRDKCRTPRIV